MSVIIKYNGVEFFKSNKIATPMFSKSAEKDLKGINLGFKESYELSGQISSGSDSCDDFLELRKKQKIIINGFKENFKSLEVLENNIVIFHKDFVKIKSITFSDSNYIGILDFSVQITCVDEKNYNNFFGVKKPSITSSVSTGRNGIKSISRQVSASGVNTQDGSLVGENISAKNSSLQNAINFVKENIDFNLSELHLGEEYYLMSESESINRIENSYSLSREYQADTNESGPEKGVLTYSTSISKPEVGIHLVNVSGSLSFGINYDFEKVRKRLREIDFFKIAQEQSGVILVDKPLTKSFSESQSNGTITFDVSFDNDDNFNSCGVSDSASYSISNIGEKVSISISGKVEARGPIKERFKLVEERFYNDIQVNVRSKAESILNDFYPAPTPTPQSSGCGGDYFTNKIKNLPSSFSVVENKNSGYIEYNYNFESSFAPDGFSSFEASIEFDFPVEKYIVNHNAGGGMDKFILSSSGKSIPSVSVTCSGAFENSTNKLVAKEKIEKYIDMYNEEINCIEPLIGLEFIEVEKQSSEPKSNNYIEIRSKRNYYNKIV